MSRYGGDEGGFFSGMEGMQRIFDERDQDKDRDIQTQSSSQMRQEQGNLMAERLREMPAELNIRQKNAATRAAMIPLRQMALMLKARTQQQATNNMGGRMLTPLQKAQNGMQQIAQSSGAIRPDGSIDESKIKGQNLLNYRQLLQYTIKQTSDPKTRQQLLNSNQVQSTINSIDPSVLAHYAGQNGKIQLAKDVMAKKSGKTTPELDAYLTTINSTIPALSDQLTKYWGTSITPEKTKEIHNMLNPKSWVNDPQTAYNSFNAIKEIFEAERANTLGAITNPDTYTQGTYAGSQVQAATPENMADKADAGNQPIKGKSGKSYTPEDVIKLAKSSNVPVAKMVQIIKESG